MNAPDSGLLERLLGMVRVARQGDGHCAFAAGDFCYRWQTEASFPAPVRIWSDGMGMDRGFAWLNGDQLHLVTTDSSELLLAEMLGWGEGLAKDFSGMTGLSVPADDSGSRLRRLLTEKGYEAAEPH
ncbi:MAG: hypothetical protein R2849_14765 [Thermomicrobiales bacterium]